MKKKLNQDLPLHKYVALGGNPKSKKTTKGVVSR